MIVGYLSDKLVAKGDVQSLMAMPEVGLDRRSTRLFDGKVDGRATQKSSPLDLVKLQISLPQLQGDGQQRNENLIQQIMNSNFNQQIEQLCNPPSIDLVHQIKKSAETIRLHYQV